MARKGRRRRQQPSSPETAADTKAANASDAATSQLQRAHLTANPLRSRKAWIRLVILCCLLGGLFALRSWWWPPVFHRLALNELRVGHNQEALEWLEYVDWLVPSDARTTLLRARAYRKQGEMDVVAELLDVAREQGAHEQQIRREEILAYAQSGQMRSAQPHLADLLSDPDEDLDDVCEAFVIGYMRNQRFGDAFALLEAWTQDSPDLATPFLLRGKLLAYRDEFDKAESDLRRAIELNPELHDARFELALVFAEVNRFGEAIELLEECLTSPELRTLAHLHLAVCLKATGDGERALELLLQARLETPNEQAVVLELGRTQYENGDYETAAATLTEAVALNPLDDEAHYILAQSLTLCGRKEEAEPHFEFVAEARSAKAEIDRLNGIVREDPTDVESLVALGELYLKHANAEEGVIRLLSALDLDPGNQTARRLLVEYYSDKAEVDPAYAALAEEHRRLLH